MSQIAEGRAIELYRGVPLEKTGIPSVLTELRDENKLAEVIEEGRFYLAGDIVINDFGIVGFVLIDKQPEQRWNSYTDPELFGEGTNVPVVLEEVCKNDPIRKAHFLGTKNGFKMIRYFALPQNIRDFFQRDRFVGEGYIHKCAQEGTLQEDFDEEQVKSDFWLSEKGSPALVEAIVDSTIPHGSDYDSGFKTRIDIGRYIYVSFHPWVVYPPVVQEGQESIYRAMANFEELLSRVPQTTGIIRKGLGDMLPSSDLPALPSAG